MNDLPHISEQLFQLFQSGGVPEELLAGGALRSQLDEQRCLQLRFQPQRQGWMLGVDQTLALLDEQTQAQVEEALLRVGHTSRWGMQVVGALDSEDCISLVDCDFLGTPQQVLTIASAQVIEGRIGALLQQLDNLQVPLARGESETIEPSQGPLEMASQADEASAWIKA